MIAATRNWLRRNRTTFAVGFGALGVAYVASQYVVSKITEARERMSSDRIARENLRRRFEQNQEDCTFTVLALLPTATDNILEALPVESITRELQQKKAERLARTSGSGGDVTASSDFSSGAPSVSATTATDDDGRSLAQSESGFVHASQQLGDSTQQSPQTKKSKAQLWDELKINAITRVFTLIYTLSLLTLLTRIQLNLLGRRNYLSSVVTLASHSIHSQQQPPTDPSTSQDTISLENRDEDASTYLSRASYGNDFETNRQYLTFSWWLLHRGWRQLMHEVRAAVTDVFGPLNPREDLSLARLSELTLAIRRRVEGSTASERSDPTRWLPYLLPPHADEPFVLSQSGAPSPPSSTTPTDSISPALRRLLNETTDLLASPHASHVLTLLLDAAFTHLIDVHLATQSFNLPPPTPDSRIEELPDTSQLTAKLASVLAGMTRAAHAVGGTHLPSRAVAGEEGEADAEAVKNEYLEKIEAVAELGGLSAVVFSANWGAEEVVEDAGAVGGKDAEGGNLSRGAEQTVDESHTADSGFGFESAWGKATGSASS